MPAIPDDELRKEMSGFEDRCRAAFDELFFAAKSRSEGQYVLSLNAEHRGPQDAGWSTAEESGFAFRQYLELLNSLPPSPIRMRVALSLYSHISEAAGFYEIPKNMLRVAGGEVYQTWPFKHLAKYKPAGDAIAPNSNKIMKDLIGHAKTFGFDKLLSVILDAFDPEIRNGYAHADYIIWNNELRLPKRSGGLRRVVGLEEFTIKVNRGLTFFECLWDTVGLHKSSYSEPKEFVGQFFSEGEPLSVMTVSYDQALHLFSIRARPIS